MKWIFCKDLLHSGKVSTTLGGWKFNPQYSWYNWVILKSSWKFLADFSLTKYTWRMLKVTSKRDNSIQGENSCLKNPNLLIVTNMGFLINLVEKCLKKQLHLFIFYKHLLRSNAQIICTGTNFYLMENENCPLKTVYLVDYKKVIQFFFMGMIMHLMKQPYLSWINTAWFYWQREAQDNWKWCWDEQRACTIPGIHKWSPI